MRPAAVTLVLISTVIHLLLGVTYIMASSYRPELGPRPATSASLVPGEPGRAPSPPPPRRFGAPDGSTVVFGALCLASAALGLGAVVLLAARRRKPITLALLGAAIVALVVHLAAGPDGKTLSLIGGGLLLLALGATLLVRVKGVKEEGVEEKPRAHADA